MNYLNYSYNWQYNDALLKEEHLVREEAAANNAAPMRCTHCGESFLPRHDAQPWEHRSTLFGASDLVRLCEWCIDLECTYIRINFTNYVPELANKYARRLSLYNKRN